MKENIEKKIETFVYGILSLVFGAAFFFGVLYPSQGVSPNAYRVTKTVPLHNGVKNTTHSCPYATYPHADIREKIGSYDTDEIHYTFYLYKRLKNS